MEKQLEQLRDKMTELFENLEETGVCTSDLIIALGYMYDAYELGKQQPLSSNEPVLDIEQMENKLLDLELEMEYGASEGRTFEDVLVDYYILKDELKPLRQEESYLLGFGFDTDDDEDLASAGHLYEEEPSESDLWDEMNHNYHMDVLNLR